jgi:magnesium-transporting ATPase (P-type)
LNSALSVSGRANAANDGSVARTARRNRPRALATLHVDPNTGLTQVKVAARRRVHGFNEVTERKGHPALAFLGTLLGHVGSAPAGR